MRAVVVDPSDGSLSVRPVAVTAPGPGEVRLRVVAAAVNPADAAIARGLRPQDPPHIPGMDAAGYVDAVGDGVERLSVGDAVMAAVRPGRATGGAYQDLVVVPGASVIAAPAGLDLREAATLPMNGLTALRGLADLALRPGSTLAVTGGGGVLGSLVISLAKLQGLIVIADSSAGGERAVRGFGADHVIERSAGFADAVRTIRPHGVDAVFDTAVLTSRALPAIRDGGSIALVRGLDGLIDAGRTVRAIPVSVMSSFEETGWLEQLADQAAAGHLTPRFAGAYAPGHVAEAWARMDAGGVGGRLVIEF